MKTKPENLTAAIHRRIKRFYHLLNEEKVDKCYLMIDPRLRKQASSVTLLQYANSLKRAREKIGKLDMVAIRVRPYVGIASRLYEGRDFAVGTAVCRGSRGRQFVFQERWVRDGRLWFTRSTGLVSI